MPDEDKNFGGSFVLEFRKWWRQVKSIYIVFYLHKYINCKYSETSEILFFALHL